MLRSTMPVCTSMAQRTAPTTLRNSMIEPSPVRLTMRPWWSAMVGSMRSLRSALRRARVLSSSAPASRLYPTTSATRIAASFRVSLIAHPPGVMRHSTKTGSNPRDYLSGAMEPKEAARARRRVAWVGSTRSRYGSYLRKAEVQGLQKRCAQHVRITGQAWTCRRHMRRHSGATIGEWLLPRFNFLFVEATWQSRRRSGQISCCLFYARLAPADGTRVGRQRLHFTKRQFSSTRATMIITVQTH
jgi:hypothetical protein